MGIRISAVILISLMYPACSDNVDHTPPSTVSTSLDGFCTAACERVNQCEVTSDKDTCVNQCKNAHAAELFKLRPEVIAQSQSCMKSRDCKAVMGPDFRKSCLDESTALVSPSKAGIALCERWAQAVMNCRLPVDRPHCLEQVKRYSDVAIQNAGACTTKACAQLDPCFNATLGSATNYGAWYRAPRASDFSHFTRNDECSGARLHAPDLRPPAPSPRNARTSSVHAQYACGLPIADPIVTARSDLQW